MFFQPTPKTLLPAFLITALATAAMYYALNCALDGSGSCLQLPFVVQVVLIALLWPWVIAVRFLSANIAFASVIGFALSLMWVFLIICVVRWGITKLTMKNEQ